MLHLYLIIELNSHQTQKSLMIYPINA